MIDPGVDDCVADGSNVLFSGSILRGVTMRLGVDVPSTVTFLFGVTVSPDVVIVLGLTVLLRLTAGLGVVVLI